MASTSIHNGEGSGQLRPQSSNPSTHHEHGTIEPGEIAVGVVIGRASEYFDFFVYALASVLVFPAVFFPNEPKLEGTLYAFVIFAFAFLARPIGTTIFMAIQKHYGREVKLTLALFMLGFSTAGIALLPTYEHIGVWAIILLSLLRVGQGVALGGAWDGLPSLLAMNAPPNKRGWYAALGQLGAPLGFVIAASLFAYMLATLTTADFLEWGWRFPFYVAFAINVVALFSRLRLVSAPEYAKLLDERELEPAGVVELATTQGRNIIIGALAALASYALFHLVTVFPLSWIKLYSLREASAFLVIQIWGGVIMAAGIVVSGLIADRFGRRNTLGSMALLIAILSAFVPSLMNGGESGQNTFILIGFALLGLSYGQAAGAVTANFKTRYRYTGAALTSDLAWLVGAGFAPLVALGLSAHFGMAYVSFYLLSGAVGSLAALSLNRALEGRDD